MIPISYESTASAATEKGKAAHPETKEASPEAKENAMAMGIDHIIIRFGINESQLTDPKKTIRAGAAANSADKHSANADFIFPGFSPLNNDLFIFGEMKTIPKRARKERENPASKAMADGSWTTIARAAKAIGPLMSTRRPEFFAKRASTPIMAARITDAEGPTTPTKAMIPAAIPMGRHFGGKKKNIAPMKDTTTVMLNPDKATIWVVPDFFKFSLNCPENPDLSPNKMPRERADDEGERFSLRLRDSLSFAENNGRIMAGSAAPLLGADGDGPRAKE